MSFIYFRSYQRENHAKTGTNAAIPADNIGSKLLRKMGWKEGEGLGKDGQGITKPVEAEGYVKGAGIGVRGGKSEIVKGKFVDKVRVSILKRFEEQL